MRLQGQMIIGDNLIAEALPFTFRDELNSSEEVRSAPCVEVNSLTAKIIQQLKIYDK